MFLMHYVSAQTFLPDIDPPWNYYCEYITARKRKVKKQPETELAISACKVKCVNPITALIYIQMTLEIKILLFINVIWLELSLPLYPQSDLWIPNDCPLSRTRCVVSLPFMTDADWFYIRLRNHGVGMFECLCKMDFVLKAVWRLYIMV